jgi:hypothetical protein
VQITHEEPGRRLEMADTDRYLVPIVIGLGLTALVATPWRGLWAVRVHGAGFETIDWVPTLLWAAFGLFLVVRTFGGGRLLDLTFDRGAGHVAWHRSHVFGLVRWSGSIPLESLGGFALALASKPGSLSPKQKLALRRREGAREDRFDLGLSGLRDGEHVADLGLRLAAAAGLPYYRVTLNEGGRFAMEASASAQPGFERVPSTAGAALDGGGALGTAAAAAAAQERLPPFDPAAFRGDARIKVWEPGREVRFEKGWGPSMLLSPLLLAAALGPVAFFRLPSLHTMPLLPRVAAVALITLVGLGLALIGYAGVALGLPRRVCLDWATGTLRVEKPRQSRTVRLDAVEAVEQRNKSFSTRRASGGMTRTSHWSQILLRLREPAFPRDELVIQTREFQEDKDSPRAMALPLGRELAAALRVSAVETYPPNPGARAAAIRSPMATGR